MAADIYPGNQAIGNAMKAAVVMALKSLEITFGNTDPCAESLEETGVVSRLIDWMDNNGGDLAVLTKSYLDANGPGYPDGGDAFAALVSPLFADPFLYCFSGKDGSMFWLSGHQAGIAPRLGPVLAGVVVAPIIAALGTGNEGAYPGHPAMRNAIVNAVVMAFATYLAAAGFAGVLASGLFTKWPAPLHAVVDPLIINPV